MITELTNNSTALLSEFNITITQIIQNVSDVKYHHHPQIYSTNVDEGVGVENISLGLLNTTFNQTISSFIKNGTNYELPEIPSYIRTTSMVFCIVIMCLGVIGNVMVSAFFPITIFMYKK